VLTDQEVTGRLRVALELMDHLFAITNRV
jgi:hypothetical protein